MNESLLSIGIVHQQPLFRQGIAYILDAAQAMQVLIETETVEEVKATLAAENLHILLIEDESFITYEQEIKQMMEEEIRDVKIVILAKDMSEETLITFMHFGVDGILMHDMTPATLLHALEEVATGIIYVDPKLSTLFLQSYRRLEVASDRNKEVKRPLHLYTKRECEILEMLGKGQNNNEIAQVLKISEKTVKNHVSNLFKKMEVHSRTEAVVKAIRHRWIDMPSL